MANTDSTQKQAQSKLKKWLINIVILIIATIVIVTLAESAMRWLDGYQLSTFELQQDTSTTQEN